MVGLTDSARWLLGASRGTPNAQELAVERLGSAIQLGVFPVGGQLPPERDLAGVVGVSRATLREAIRLLTEQGTLVAQRGRAGGTFVVRYPTPPHLADVTRQLAKGPTSLTEILDQRWAVETAVADLAAQRASASQIDRLLALLPLLEAAHDDTFTYRSLDTELHFTVGEAAGSHRLGELLAESHRELADLMAVVPHSAEIRKHSSSQHRRLVKAIQRHRPDLARAVMAEHVAATASFLLGLVGDRSEVDGTPPPMGLDGTPPTPVGPTA